MPMITMTIDANAVTAGLKAAAAAANQEAVKGIRKASKEIALPKVKQAVAGKLPGKTSAGATSQGGYVQQTHPGAAIVEFGGTRNDVIRPKTGKALSTPAGPRAAVKGPRTYQKTLALTKAAHAVKPLMEEPTKQALLDAYRKQGFQVT